MRILSEPLSLGQSDEDFLEVVLKDIVRRAEHTRMYPIQYAPKTRPILVFCPSHNLEAYQDFFAVARWVDSDYDGREGWFDNFDMLHPTHWTELPEPPRGNS
jgi:hypothetical protein